jgi:hypothetical protein
MEMHMARRYSPTVAEITQALADAAAYWEAEEVEVFLFGATVAKGMDADLFADEVSAIAAAA